MPLRGALVWPAVLALGFALAACVTDPASSRKTEPTATTSEPGSRPSDSPLTTTSTAVGSTTPGTSPPSATRPPTGPVSPPSTVYGSVTAGPTCPVERIDQPCPPRPLQTTVQATSTAGGTGGSATTDDEGRYQMSLPPGRYVLSAQSGAVFPQCQPVEVAVIPNSATRADISCDTGIRN
jgi:hypothetical protein